MDKTLESFLHPHRKPNVKFTLPSFDAQMEMRALTAQEGLDNSDLVESRGLKNAAALVPTIATALIVPNLRSKELLDALSEKEGRKILNSYDAAISLFSEAEIAKLIEIYNTHFNVTASFSEDVETAKN